MAKELKNGQTIMIVNNRTYSEVDATVIKPNREGYLVEGTCGKRGVAKMISNRWQVVALY